VKGIGLSLFIAVLFAISGCGGEGSSSQSSKPNDQNITPPTDPISEGEEPSGESYSGTDPLGYVNYLRVKTGMPTMVLSSALQLSAQNHADYLQNRPLSHDEISGNSGFTGEKASDRAVVAGYFYRGVGENITTASSPLESIDNLMSAIYHRFGFLSFDYDEIGRGSASYTPLQTTVYNYNMGNTLFNAACQEEESGSVGVYFTGVCADASKRISFARWKELNTTHMNKQPDYARYPYADAEGVSPVFYEEIPDPLPDYDMTGNPISIQFHPKYSDATVHNMTLYRVSDGATISLMNLKTRYPSNHRLTSTQFAYFPIYRLDWGERYRVKATLQLQSVSAPFQIEWSFKTKTLKETVLPIREDTTRYVIQSGKTYSLYFVPDNTINRIDQGYSTQFPSDVKVIQGDAIDSNTYPFSATGVQGREVQLTYRTTEHSRTVTFVIE